MSHRSWERTKEPNRVSYKSNERDRMTIKYREKVDNFCSYWLDHESTSDIDSALEELLKQVAREALEEAAVIAEKEKDNWDDERLCLIIAKSIRAKKEEI